MGKQIGDTTILFSWVLFFVCLFVFVCFFVFRGEERDRNEKKKKQISLA